MDIGTVPRIRFHMRPDIENPLTSPNSVTLKFFEDLFEPIDHKISSIVTVVGGSSTLEPMRLSCLLATKDRQTPIGNRSADLLKRTCEARHGIRNIKVEDLIFATEGSVAVGSVRSAGETVHAFFENFGEAELLPEHIVGVNDGKVMLAMDNLPKELRDAIGHAHDVELSDAAYSNTTLPEA